MSKFLTRVSKFVFSITLILISYSAIKAQEEAPILFWGDGCPHCTEVKEEINESPTLSGIEIEYLEIYNDQANSDIFQEKLEECGFSSYQAGVPMLYSNGTCWMGKFEVIEGLEASITGESSRTQLEEQELESEEEIVQEFEQEDMSIVESTVQDDSSEGGGNTVMYILISGLVLLSILFVAILFTKPTQEKQK